MVRKIHLVLCHFKLVRLWLESGHHRSCSERNKVGGAVVNDCFLHAGVEDLPFGGVGASGMGQYHGQAGFETFSKLKPVLYQSRWNGMWLLYPPYGRRTNTIINLLLKRKAKT